MLAASLLKHEKAAQMRVSPAVRLLHPGPSWSSTESTQTIWVWGPLGPFARLRRMARSSGRGTLALIGACVTLSAHIVRFRASEQGLVLMPPSLNDSTFNSALSLILCRPQLSLLQPVGPEYQIRALQGSTFKRSTFNLHMGCLEIG